MSGGWDPMALPPESCLSLPSALPGAPANPLPQPRSLTSKAPAHRGKRQCDKKAKELVNGLRCGTALALSYEWKHTVEAAKRGCGETGPVSVSRHGFVQRPKAPQEPVRLSLLPGSLKYPPTLVL